ncbi:MAG: glycosyltransferase, partial [Anaerolineae bacterium]|nr:glycosyltransferase [Anaerolineae bacterium]
PTHGPQRVVSRVSVERLPISRWPLDILVSFLYQSAMIKRFSIQVTLVTHWAVNGPAAWWCRRLFSTPYVVTAHAREILPRSASNAGWFAHRQFRSMQRVFNSASCVLAVSRYTRQRLEKSGVRPDHIRVVPNAVNAKDFAVADKDEVQALRERWRIKGKRVILSVGRLVKRKGLDAAIRAMPLITAEVPGAVYLIVGSGPEEQSLCALAQSLDMEDRIIFTGYVPQVDLLNYYHLCDMFVMPCREIVTPGRIDAEGFGIVFLEANACSKPVVAGRSGGVPDAVLDSQTGFLVDPLDVRAIAQATIRLLEDRDLATRLGENGRRRIEKEMNWTRAVQVIRDTISRVVAER